MRFPSKKSGSGGLGRAFRKLKFWNRPKFRPSAPTVNKNYVRKFFKRLWVFTEPVWSLAPKKSLFDLPNKPSLKAYLNPFFWTAWASKFLLGWLISRPYLNLAPALPAIIGAIAFCVFVYWDRYQGTAWRLTQYRRTLQASIDQKDYDVAAISCRTLINLTPYDDTLRFQQALIEYDRGEVERAEKMMLHLAATKQNALAAAWLLSNRYDLATVEGWSPEEHSSFRALVNAASRHKDRSVVDSAQIKFASYLAQKGATRDSLKIVADMADRNPRLNLIGVGLALQCEDKPLAIRFANSAVRFLEQSLKSDPDSLAERLDLAKTLVFLEREQEAARVLQDASQLSGDEKIKNGIAEILVHYSQRIAKQGESSLIQRLQVLRNAMNYAPNNPMVVDATVEIVLSCKEQSGTQAELLRQSIIKGAAPEATHFIQGTYSLLKGDTATALNHLKIAQSTGLNTPGLLNNMAMALQASGDSQKLQYALELSNSAMGMLPNHPYLHDTRGQIYLKLKRYEPAIADLEFALRAPELASGVHQSLALAYTALGQEDLAAEHRKLVTAPPSTSNP